MATPDGHFLDFELKYPIKIFVSPTMNAVCQANLAQNVVCSELTGDISFFSYDIEEGTHVHCSVMR